MFKIVTYKHKDKIHSEVFAICIAEHKVSYLLRDGAFVLSVVTKTTLAEAQEYRTNALERSRL